MVMINKWLDGLQKRFSLDSRRASSYHGPSPLILNGFIKVLGCPANLDNSVGARPVLLTYYAVSPLPT